MICRLKLIYLRSERHNGVAACYMPVLYSDFNPKAISKLMGHAKELVTVDIYGDKSNIIPEEIPELLAYMKDVMPSEEMQKSLNPNVLDIVIDVERYLPRKPGH